MIKNKIISAYKGNCFKRYDNTGDIFYFSPEDFEGLVCEPYSFTNQSGCRLQGYFYYYGEPNKSRIVIFEHGMGGGHRAYMKEIALLAERGYFVFSYDRMGCMESEGKATNGFLQSLADLDDCICALKADERYRDASFSVIGHSWGAFSTLNIAAIHSEVTHIVAMAGFVSIKQMHKQFFPGVLRIFRPTVYRVEKEANPKYIDFDARESLKKSNVKALIIHSEDDPIVSAKHHFYVMKAALGDCDNKTFLLLNGKGHSPSYTEDAVQYMNAFFATRNEKNAKGELSDEKSQREFLAKYDWHRMTAQDMTVWEKIFAFLEM